MNRPPETNRKRLTFVMSISLQKTTIETRTGAAVRGGATRECEQLTERLNRECRCVSLNREAMRAELLRQLGDTDLYRMITEERPHLFTESAVFVAETCIQRQRDIIAAVERVVALPAYQERVLSYAPSTAKFVPEAHGVFFGYDFHLSSVGPQLIEINTNAGGALLNAVLANAQKACCELAGGAFPGAALKLIGELDGQELEQTLFAMFLEEWRKERGQIPLRSIAIVDDTPQSQYLLPEFILFEKMFERNGIDAVICDPSALIFRDDALWHEDRRIDLVYNRLTDFGLEAESHKDLCEAYLAGAVVVTPHPRAHALYADKRNLALLTDDTALREIGVDVATRNLLLAGIAGTVCVRREDAETLWSMRKRFFFKPAAGYGSKAAYRGDKLTRRVFDEILQGDYVAQTLVPPSGRQLKVGHALVDFKVDLRNYVYQGRIQLVTARLYQGQTTNFRTPGGGFAQVVAVPCR